MKPFEERYTLRLPLGENDLGSIWTAQDNDTGASVAVVMLEEEAGEAVRARFRDHAERLLGVTHPNVVRALAHGDTADGTPFLVLELLEGESLAARFSQASLRVDRAVEWLAGAAEGLGALHAAGIAHGDIEPGNVFLAGPKDKEIAKIIGLALNRVDARAGNEAAARTSLASLQQGYAYAAPEQLRGEVQATSAADLYSLGAVAYAVLAGRPPFVAPDAGSLLEAVRTKRPPGLGAVKRELAGYATILERALSAEPSRRFTDGAAFARALRTCLLMSRPTAALELPAGPRSPVGALDALEPAAASKPAAVSKLAAASKPSVAPEGASTATGAPKPLAAPRPLGGRPLPKPAGSTPKTDASARDVRSTAPEAVASAENVSESATMAHVAAPDSAPEADADGETPASSGERVSIDVAFDVSDSATNAPASVESQADASTAAPEAPREVAAPVVAAPALDDVSEVTTVKGASPEVPATATEVAAPALDDVSEVTTVKGASPVASEPAPAIAAPTLDDVSEVTTVKGAAPVEEPLSLDEVSEVSEVSAVLLAPSVPRDPAPRPPGSAPAGGAALRTPVESPAAAASDDADAAAPLILPASTRSRWLVPGVLMAAALLGLGVWSATRGVSPEEPGGDFAAPSMVGPVGAPSPPVAAELEGVETAVAEPGVMPQPMVVPAEEARDPDAGVAVTQRDSTPVEAAVTVAAPSSAQAPAEAAPADARPNTLPPPARPAASPALARAPAVARGDAPAVPRAPRPTSVRAPRTVAARPARPAARPASGTTSGRPGARPTVISDPGF